MENHAKIASATLEIFVPYPPELAEKVKAENAAAKAALEGFPNHACKLIRVADLLAQDEFERLIPADTFRDEFRRKAKQLKLKLPEGTFPMNIDHGENGFKFSVWVKP